MSIKLEPYASRRKRVPALSCLCMFAALSSAVISLAAQEPAPARSPETIRGAGWVVIPVDQYQALRIKAYPVERAPDPPPVAATMTRVDYDLHIRGDLASGRATLTVDVIDQGWVYVPVPTGLLVREARLDGKLLSLVKEPGEKDGSRVSALLSHPGRALLTLDIALPVASSAGSDSLSLPPTAFGVTRASVELPRHGLDVQLGGGFVSEKFESPTGSRWLAYGRGNEPLTFTWRRRIEDHHIDEPLRQRGSLTQLVGLGEDATSIYAEVDLEVTQGVAREARVQLPAEVTVNQVQGATVADWEADAKSGELAVKFLEPVEHSARFVISGEMKTARDGKIDIPLLRMLNIERDTGGGVAVEVLGAGEIKSHTTHGLQDADATDLGPMIAGRQSPSLMAFRFQAGDGKAQRSLTVDVARYTQQAMLMANVEEARYRILISNQGKTMVEARYAIRNNQRNFLKITLPAGAVLWSASLGGNPVRPGQSPDGSLLLPLEKSHAGEEAAPFAVEIVYLNRGTPWEQQRGKTALALPALDLPISRTGLLLYHPPLFKVTAEPGTFMTKPYEDPSSAALNPAVAATVDTKQAVQSEETDRLEQVTRMDDDEVHKEQKPSTQALVDKYLEKSKGHRTAGILPIAVEFPAIGPSMFLVSELTSENQSSNIALSYERDKKGVSQ